MMQQADITLGIGARSEKGRREDNQDKMTAFSTPLGTFYIVADGMGGHRGGAEASLSVVEGYRKHLQAFPEAADFADVLQHATTLTNAEILAAGRSGDPSIAGMGSTVVMAMLRSEPGAGPGGMEVLTAHIGDSRAYLLRGGKLTQLTHDHSAVQRMVDEGLISAEAAKTHPDLNVLTRAIGKQADILIEVGQRLALYPGDTILLCTDGLWGHVPEEQIAYELSVDRSTSETADTLVQLALDRGSDDNITLQILRLEDRNAAGRPYTPPVAAPVVVSPATLPAPQRGATTTPMVAAAAPMAMAAAPAPSGPGAIPPVMRTEAYAPPKRKTHAWIYALLLAAFIALAAAAGIFAKKYQNDKAAKVHGGSQTPTQNHEPTQPANTAPVPNKPIAPDGDEHKPHQRSPGQKPSATVVRVTPRGIAPGTTPPAPSPGDRQAALDAAQGKKEPPPDPDPNPKEPN